MGLVVVVRGAFPPGKAAAKLWLGVILRPSHVNPDNVTKKRR